MQAAGENNQIILSLDGVSESKSTSISLDVYSIKFRGCRDVYPVKIIRPIVKNQVDDYEQFRMVLEDLKQNGLKIDCCVGDNPKRSFMRNSLQAAGKICCEYCFESGVQCVHKEEKNVDYIKKLEEQKLTLISEIDSLHPVNDTDQIEALNKILDNLKETEKIVKQKKTSHIVWPSSTMNGEMRTREKIVEIVEKIESGTELTAFEKKGIKGRSLLLDIEDFDYVLQLPTEYMHLVSLGVVKRLLELTFSVGENRYRVTKRPLTSPNLFNDLMKYIKVPREFSRRARKLDLAVLKAQELRNLLIFFSQ